MRCAQPFAPGSSLRRHRRPSGSSAGTIVARSCSRSRRGSEWARVVRSTVRQTRHRCRARNAGSMRQVVRHAAFAQRWRTIVNRCRHPRRAERLAARIIVHVEHATAAAWAVGGPIPVGVREAPPVCLEVRHVFRNQRAASISCRARPGQAGVRLRRRGRGSVKGRSGLRWEQGRMIRW